MKKHKFIAGFALAAILSLTISCGQSKASSSNGQETQEPIEAVMEIENLDASKIKIVDGLIIPEGIPVVVDFNATWCGPCHQYAPIYHSVAEKFTGKAIFLSIDVDQHPEIANRYDVKSIPFTAFILPGGGVMGTEVGVLRESALQTFVLQLLSQVAGEGDAI